MSYFVFVSLLMWIVWVFSTEKDGEVEIPLNMKNTWYDDDDVFCLKELTESK